MFHHHMRGRDCGPRGGRFSRGPFTVEWEFAGDGRHGGRSRRMFDGGELRLVLLKLIEEQPRHGYDLIRDIEERTSGAYAPSPGVVYPTLTMLEDMGLIEEQKAEGAKKLYAITNAGQAHLTEREEEVEALFARLQDIGSRRARTSGGPVMRAMGNLKSVLQQRLSDGEIDSETIHKVAALIDEAVQKIERL